uniref:NACHT domain-containing protein n=1 Tax=Psilocybe cubensis TaxID=181762 RepID=A0A8H8CH39_PSICU
MDLDAHQLLLSGIISSIDVEGDILKNDKNRSFYWVHIYVDNHKVIKSKKSQSRSRELSWKWDSDNKIGFTPSSVVKVELHRGFKGGIIGKIPQTKVHVAQFAERIERLLDNDSKSFALVDRKGKTIAQINMSLSLCATRDELISDFMKKVDGDVDDLKGIEGVSKRALLVLGPVLQNTRVLMNSVADATHQTEIQDQSIRELAETLREMLATTTAKLDLPRIPDAVDLIKEIGFQSLQVASLIHEYTQPSFSEDIMNEVKNEVCKVKDDALAEKIFKWLWPSDRPIDISKNYNEAHGKRQRQTCSWFLEDERFGRWLHHPGFIWVHGKAGCGKTILMASIINKLPDPSSSTGIVYFFFDARDGQTDSQLHIKFIRSLAYQLCDSRHGGIPQEMVDLHTKCGASQPLDDQLEETMQHILEGFDRVFIAIDALDECSDRQKTLDWVRKLLTNTQLQTDIHLLITSRHETDITNVFKDLGGDSIDVVNPTNKDIEDYISKQMECSKLQRFNEQIRGEVESKLRDCADGSFRYTALMLAELEQCSTLSKLEKALTKFPNGLDEIYDRILRKCKDEDALDLRRFLQFLAFSMEAITLSELAETVTIEFSSDDQAVFNPKRRYLNPSDILELCGGLVVMSKDERNTKEFIKLSHFSVKEYLISTRVQNRFCLANTAQSRIDISKTLMSYLLETYLINDTSDASAFPLKNYAAETWDLHVGYHGIDADTTVFKMAARLLRSGIPVLTKVAIGKFDLSPKESQCLKKGLVEIEPRPLQWASLLGLVGVVEHLLAEVDNNNPDREQLEAASSRSSVHASKVCQKRAIDVNVNTVGGKYGTALQAASNRGHELVVETLLKHGADVNAVAGKYGTALQAACYRGHESVVQALLKHGADVNVVSGKYGTALQSATLRCSRQSVVEALLKHGADVNAMAGKFGTALQAASYEGNQSLIELLIKHGANVNAVDSKHKTALQVASNRGNLLAAKALLKHGADVNHTVPGYFATALQAASSKGHYSLVDLLLNNGADVNVSGGYHGNALQAACFQSHNKVIELLLNNKAEVTSLVHLARINDPALQEKLRAAYSADKKNISNALHTTQAN